MPHWIADALSFRGQELAVYYDAVHECESNSCHPVTGTLQLVS